MARSEQQSLAGIGAGLVPFALFILLIGFYLIVKTVNVVYRAFKAAPRNVFLWAATVSVVASVAGTIGSKGQVLAVIALVISALSLIIIARIIDLRHNHLLHENIPTIDKVLRRKWWRGASNQALAA
jgi:hypothetical protein